MLHSLYHRHRRRRGLLLLFSRRVDYYDDIDIDIILQVVWVATTSPEGRWKAVRRIAVAI
jgi:hypothetical protein